MEVTQISQQQAVQAFAAVRDPLGTDTPESMADAACGQFVTDSGVCVFAMEKKGSVLWIRAAAGQGADLTAHGLALAEATAAQLGCDRVGFQTARRGLVRLAMQDKFFVTGWILEKKI